MTLSAGLLAWSERKRVVLTVTGWTVAIVSIVGQALLQRAYMTALDIVLLTLTCLLAGIILVEIEHALIGYIFSVGIALGILYTLFTMPATTGLVPCPGCLVIYNLWIGILFKAFFPFPFLASLVASIVGAMIGDRYLEI